ncbi:MAG: hypothetical protein ACRC6T_03275 [Sarcina sp.]
MMNKKELDYTESLIQILRDGMQERYLAGTTKRGAHPKTLGILKAEFKVMNNLQNDLRVGVFKEAKTYKSIIRISSSSSEVEGDEKKDARGFAIKLLNVVGEKFLSEEKNSQDFILLSSEIFPFSTLKSFHDLVYAKENNKILPYLAKSTINGDVFNLVKLLGLPKNQASPLSISYFSTTSFKFGDNIVRYSIVPKIVSKVKVPKDMTATYLSTNMQKQLDKGKIVFDFKVQIQKAGMKDDPSVIWNKKKSPYVKVAEIIIDKQDIMNKFKSDIAEIASFNVGHSLMEHRPVGEFNVARMKIYSELSEYRHRRNGISKKELTENEYYKMR